MRLGRGVRNGEQRKHQNYESPYDHFRFEFLAFFTSASALPPTPILSSPGALTIIVQALCGIFAVPADTVVSFSIGCLLFLRYGSTINFKIGMKFLL
jgi:hypothetical protein